MANPLSNELLAQLFSQVSSDPFLMLVTISHESFDTIRLVNNMENITSRGEVYQAFPMTIGLPVDDGETAREVSIIFDNVSRELVDEIRTVTDPMDILIEMILASDPDEVQMSIPDLKLGSVVYDSQKVQGKLYMDEFLGIAMTSEQYTPTNFRGIF